MNRQMLAWASALIALVWTGLALAWPAVAETELQPLNIPAIVMFLVFVAAKL